MKKVRCISKMPSAGLGNKLFSWASGVVFSTINRCPHYITGLTKVHLGPIFRGEKTNRFYLGYFKNEYFILPLSMYQSKSYVKKQNECNKLVHIQGNYIFNEIPHWSDPFIVLKDYRNHIIESFWKNLTERVQNRIALYPSPFIGIHIRMGDFRALQAEEDFSKVGLVRTPLSYFAKVIDLIVKFIGSNVPITVFSDGRDNEIKEILDIPNVKRAEDDLDIVHLATLSKSKLIIMSAGSTFSHWAGFLSDGILINHFQHLHAPIRSNEINLKKYEGELNPDNEIEEYPLLCQNLKELQSLC